VEQVVGQVQVEHRAQLDLAEFLELVVRLVGLALVDRQGVLVEAEQAVHQVQVDLQEHPEQQAPVELRAQAEHLGAAEALVLPARAEHLEHLEHLE